MTSIRDELLPLYRQMLLIRRVEEEAARAYVQGKIGGFLHLYIGQEAIAVGAEAALRPTDWVITTYRDHGHALARGTSAAAIMAELFGKDTGCSRGLGGSMHMFDREHRFLGGHGIVGGHVAVASGVAFSAKYLAKPEVTVCFFGEGATNIGGFHEGLSLAGLWKLPIVFVCENNQYSMGTPLVRTMPASEVTAKAAGYGMAQDRFEGHDVRHVRDRLGEAIERARSGQGPTLVEIMTYRFRGHSMSDPGRYRTPEEVEERKQKHDPVRLARQALTEAGVGEAELDRVDREVEDEVQAAVRFADESAPATEQSMHRFVLAPSAGS
ncbi:MAG: pyruvate dehydrogenase (acetyl-transferring) E1 component subunit alpha [Sandaracinaceae bacterium]|nr:pyruvate dehydrogenase (acetyl-transferring) E1 component subunit alpha [Sandaracinaceae bacterium]